MEERIITDAQAFELAIWALKTGIENELTDEVLDTSSLKRDYEQLVKHYDPESSVILRRRNVNWLRERLKMNISDYTYSEMTQKISIREPSVAL